MSDARLVLIIGSPRSGTTWLQTILGAHPAVASPQETDLFRVYLQPLAQSWDQQVAQLRDTADDRRRKGLPTVLDAAQFDAVGRNFVTTMIESVRAHKPAATVVVEKSPGHSMATAVVRRFWPEATFIHMIRDGRDVAASLMAASHTFGAGFAPGEVTQAARMWRSRLEAARDARDAPGGYLEVRYEELHSDGAAVLQRAYEHCGIDVPLDECAATVARFGFAAMAESGAVASSIITGGEFSADARSRVEPDGFFRKGVVGGWRDEWQFSERHAFDAAAGDLLIGLGYEPDHRWVGHGRARHDWLADTRRYTAKRLRNLAAKLDH
ncbi:MAG TPA: sulfotransferase [Acidimicrobiia bacterium]